MNRNDEVYAIDIEVLAYERKGLLRDVTTVAANEDINITAANTLSNRDDYTARLVFSIEVSNLNQMSRFLAKVDNLVNVISARRMTPHLPK